MRPRGLEPLRCSSTRQPKPARASAISPRSHFSYSRRIRLLPPKLTKLGTPYRESVIRERISADRPVSFNDSGGLYLQGGQHWLCSFRLPSGLRECPEVALGLTHLPSTFGPVPSPYLRDAVESFLTAALPPVSDDVFSHVRIRIQREYESHFEPSEPLPRGCVSVHPALPRGLGSS